MVKPNLLDYHSLYTSKSLNFTIANLIHSYLQKDKHLIFKFYLNSFL